ncbi:DUF427-domain-containing protein [Boletus coccyginus]|nr:DUF427-domain-containing protein [Boletus coccyginus]
MVRVLFNNVELAKCDNPVILEAMNRVNSSSSDTSTASYYSANVDGKSVKDIAWYYAEPKAKAAHIKDHVAFYKNKVVIED